MNRFLIRFVASAVVIAALAGVAAADQVYTFYKLTNNNPLTPDIGGQLKMTVSPDGAGVKFKFENFVGIQSSITDIYFDDGSLIGPLTVLLNSAGVSFSQGANPGNLPGANLASPPFMTTLGFSADSDPPVQANGVNAMGEFVILGFGLQGSQTFADVIAELASGELRVGLHIQGFANGGSESYVNNTTPIPLPAAAWMGMALMGSVGGFGYFRRRRQQVLA